MNRFRAQVTKVIDGDTCHAVISLHPFKISVEATIRFIGIDTPERWQYGYHEAKNFVTELIDEQEVEVAVHDVDSFGRYLADIYFEGTHVNQVLLDNNLAKVYKK